MRWTIGVLAVAACSAHEGPLTDDGPCTPTECSLGFGSFATDDDAHCTPGASCGDGLTCVRYTQSNGVAKTLCAAGPADMRCNDSVPFCDGNVAVRCYEGYPIRRFDCSSRELFCNPNGGCTTHTDPLCAAERPTTLRCDGDHLVKCIGDKRSNVDCDLDAGYACGESDAGFSCLYRGTL